MVQQILTAGAKGWKAVFNSHTAEVLLYMYAGYEIRHCAEMVAAVRKARNGRIAKEKELERLKAEQEKKNVLAKAKREKEAEENYERVKRELEEAKKNDPMKKEMEHLLNQANRLLQED